MKRIAVLTICMLMFLSIEVQAKTYKTTTKFNSKDTWVLKKSGVVDRPSRTEHWYIYSSKTTKTDVKGVGRTSNSCVKKKGINCSWKKGTTKGHYVSFNGNVTAANKGLTIGYEKVVLYKTDTTVSTTKDLPNGTYFVLGTPKLRGIRYKTVTTATNNYYSSNINHNIYDAVLDKKYPEL